MTDCKQVSEYSTEEFFSTLDYVKEEIQKIKQELKEL